MSCDIHKLVHLSDLQKNFLLQETVINTDSPQVNTQRKETTQDTALNGTSGYHPLLPRIKDHDDREARETVRARGSGQLQQESVFLSQQDSDTYECRTVVITWAILYKIKTEKNSCMEERVGHELPT